MLPYFVNEILRNNLRYNFTLEHRRTKWTKTEFLMVLLVKYIILKNIKFSVKITLCIFLYNIFLFKFSYYCMTGVRDNKVSWGQSDRGGSFKSSHLPGIKTSL